jgi:hypothetical protein
VPPRTRPERIAPPRITICEDVDDVLAALSVPRRLVPPTPAEDPSQLSEALNGVVDNARPKLFEQLGVTPIEINDLAPSCALPATTVTTTLLELELAERIHRLPGHRVQLAVEWHGRTTKSARSNSDQNEQRTPQTERDHGVDTRRV